MEFQHGSNHKLWDFNFSKPEAWSRSRSRSRSWSRILKELRKTLFAMPSSKLLTLIEFRFSSLKKLSNCFAYVRRFITKKSLRRSGPFSIEETELAIESIVKVLQKIFFQKEYNYFRRNLENPENQEKFPLKSPLHQLTPFMDERGVIRVGGRIDASPMLNTCIICRQDLFIFVKLMNIVLEISF